jgi:hypothetical protein
MAKRELLGNRPAFTNYVQGRQISRTTDGGTQFGSTFDKRYYSQCDAEIYFGDIFIDELVELSFRAQQNTQPLTGYNSYMFDEIAQGARIVQGQFAVNFTSPGYLNKILASLQSTEVPQQTDTAVKKTTEEKTPAEKKRIETVRTKIDGPLWGRSFDIDVVYGKKEQKKKQVHVVLTGVTLTGCQQQLDYSGKVMLEAYSFIARDLKPITNE